MKQNNFTNNTFVKNVLDGVSMSNSYVNISEGSVAGATCVSYFTNGDTPLTNKFLKNLTINEIKNINLKNLNKKFVEFLQKFIRKEVYRI